MKAEEVQNLELAKYLEMYPEATLKDVIEHCSKKIKEELKEFAEMDFEKIAPEMQIMLNSRFEETIYADMCYKPGMKTHEEVAEGAIYNYNLTKRQISEMISNHANEILGKILVAFEKEISRLKEEKPSITTDVPVKMGETEREEIDNIDKGRVKFFERTVINDKAIALKNFAYIDRTPDRIEQLEEDLKRYSGIYGVPPEKLQEVLNNQTGRIFDEFDSLCDKYMKMIQEAIYQTAREDKTEDKEEQKVEDFDEEYKPKHQKKSENLEVENEYHNEEKPKEDSEVRKIMWQSLDEDEPVAEETVKATEPEQVEGTKKIISPELVDLASTLENFKILVKMKVDEGHTLEEALNNVQELMLLEAQKKLEEKARVEKTETEKTDLEPKKSGLEDVSNDPHVKFSDVKDAIVTIADQRNKEKKKDDNSNLDLITDSPFLR